MRIKALPFSRRAFALTLILFLSAARAEVPTTRSARADLVDLRLRDLAMSPAAQRLVRQSSWWSRQTVASITTMSAAERRRALGRDLWFEREVLKHVAPRGLRLNLTDEELRLFVEAGRPTRLSLISTIEAASLPPHLARALTTARCRTLGEVREHLLNPLLYGLPPFAGPSLTATRALRSLQLGWGQAVITPAEFAFADRLAESRVGRRARHYLRDHAVNTLDDVGRLPLQQLANGHQLDRKMAGQIKSLLTPGCARKLGSRSE